MRGFKFTLVGVAYQTANLMCRAPFEITLPEGDPRISEFRNPSFKEEAIPLPEDFGKVLKPPSGPKPGDGDNDSPQLIPLDKVEGIPPAIVEQLKEAGFATAQAVAAITPESFDLTSLKGVGESTAAKIQKLCEDAIAESLKPPSEPKPGDGD